MATKAASANGKTAAHGAAETETFVIEAPDIRTIEVPIRGISPLIVHAWSVKAKAMMLEKQTKGKARTKTREPKNPEQDYQDSRYISDDGWDGVPAAGFKAAMVAACRQVEGLSMVLAKTLFFVEADGRSTRQNVELVRIHGTPRMREDMVRLETGTADLRYRAEFPVWSATLHIRFDAGVVQHGSVLNLLARAGESIGVCEWRPSAPRSSTGQCGRFRILTADDLPAQ